MVVEVLGDGNLGCDDWEVGMNVKRTELLLLIERHGHRK